MSVASLPSAPPTEHLRELEACPTKPFYRSLAPSRARVRAKLQVVADPTSRCLRHRPGGIAFEKLNARVSCAAEAGVPLTR